MIDRTHPVRTLAVWTALAVTVALATLCAMLNPALAQIGDIPDQEVLPTLMSAVHVLSNWKSIGWLNALMVLATACMIVVIKTPVGTWLNKKGVLPYVAGGLGGVLGALGAWASGDPERIFTAAASGVTAGFAAVGLHQAIKQPLAAREDLTGKPVPKILQVRETPVAPTPGGPNP